MMQIIDDFGSDTPHYFLSNFYPSSFVYEGVSYATNEHFYQSFKALELVARRWINQAPTPGQAKRRGNTKGEFTLISNWDIMSKLFMRQGLFCKFSQNPSLIVKLLETRDAQLIEGNTWGDVIWGAVKTDYGNYVGKNQLGLMLMELREAFKLSFNIGVNGKHTHLFGDDPSVY